MQLPNDGDEFCAATALLHDLSKALSTDSVERLGQIDVGEVHIGILFLTFFLQLSCGEHHVDCTAILPEAA